MHRVLILLLEKSTSTMINLLNQDDKSGVRGISVSSKILKLPELNSKKELKREIY